MLKTFQHSKYRRISRDLSGHFESHLLTDILMNIMITNDKIWTASTDNPAELSFCELKIVTSRGIIFKQLYYFPNLT